MFLPVCCCCYGNYRLAICNWPLATSPVFVWAVPIYGPVVHVASPNFFVSFLLVRIAPEVFSEPTARENSHTCILDICTYSPYSYAASQRTFDAQCTTGL